MEELFDKIINYTALLLIYSVVLLIIYGFYVMSLTKTSVDLFVK